MAPRPALDPAVVIRPIRADDRARLASSHDRLSPESRYRRFFSAKPALTSADVSYFVDVDGCDHVALVATLPGAEGEPIIAVARFIRLPDSRDVAEMAIVVGDENQRGGLGAELVARLADAAVQRGVRRFRATMLTGNVPIRRLLENLAAGPIELRALGGGLTEMELPLPGAERAGPDCGATDALAAV